MLRMMILAGALLFTLSLLACARSGKISAGCCEMGSGECMAGKTEAQKKECKEKCEKKEQNHNCCSKGDHQH